MSLVLRLFSLACIALVIADATEDFLHEVGDLVMLPDNPSVQRWINAVKVVYTCINRRQMAIGDIFGSTYRDVCAKSRSTTKVYRGCQMVIGFKPLEQEIEAKKSSIENLLLTIGAALLRNDNSLDRIAAPYFKEMPVRVVFHVCAHSPRYFQGYANSPNANLFNAACQHILWLNAGDGKLVSGALEYITSARNSASRNHGADTSSHFYSGHGTAGAGDHQDDTSIQLSLWPDTSGHGTAPAGASGSGDGEVDTSLHL